MVSARRDVCPRRSRGPTVAPRLRRGISWGLDVGKAGRLLLLGIGQVAVIIGAVLAGQFVALETQAELSRPWPVLMVLAIFAIPSWLLLPLVGLVGRLSSRQSALRWASIALVVVSVPFLFVQDHWLLWWGLISLCLAAVLPLRASFVGLASREVAMSLVRLVSVGLFYTFAAAFIGWIVGYALWRMEGPGVPLSPAYAVLLFAFGLATTLVPPFSADGIPHTEARRLPEGFVGVIKRMWQAPSFRWALPSGSLLRGGIMATIGWLLLAPGNVSTSEALHQVTLFLFGAGLASLITTIQGHPRRLVGLLPLALTALTVLLLLQSGSDNPIGYLPALGWIAGFLLSPLHSALFMQLEDDEHLPADLLRRGLDFACAGLWAALLLGLERGAGWSTANILLVVAVLALLATGLSWLYRRREFAESLFEVILMPLYRIRGAGVGLENFPRRGPALVIANHACWFDPLFLGKVLPRKIIPMMTSLFYDIPLMRWLMVNFGEAIRVEAARKFRADVPEIQEGIAVLDRGDVLVIFPEGAMRRKEEQWLKQFGQGVAHILRERPNTPVITCWIEGNWGSFFSYYKGLPTKNKKMDFMHPIRVAAAEPRVMDPELLEDQRELRAFLMQAVIQTRGLLGLEVPSLQRDIGKEELAEA